LSDPFFPELAAEADEPAPAAATPRAGAELASRKATTISSATSVSLLSELSAYRVNG